MQHRQLESLHNVHNKFWAPADEKHENNCQKHLDHLKNNRCKLLLRDYILKPTMQEYMQALYFAITARDTCFKLNDYAEP